MSWIVAARFSTFDASSRAAAQLHREGFADDDMQVFYVGEPGMHDRYPVGGDESADPDAKSSHWGAMAGAAVLGLVLALVGGGIGAMAGGTTFVMLAAAGVGGYIGALLGALWLSGRPEFQRSLPKVGGVPTQYPAGVMLAVRIQPGQEEAARRILRDTGGIDIERLQGRWVNGQWQDFDPVAHSHEAVTAEAETPQR